MRTLERAGCSLQQSRLSSSRAPSGPMPQDKPTNRSGHIDSQ